MVTKVQQLKYLNKITIIAYADLNKIVDIKI